MQGPYEAGSIDSHIPPSAESWESRHGLIREKRYRVMKDFIDLDGDNHPSGEEWLFVAGLFSKFDDEITICIRRDGNDDWKIPLSWNAEQQQHVIENIADYVKRI